MSFVPDVAVDDSLHKEAVKPVTRLIRGKLVPPERNPRCIPRPRLARLIDEMIAHYGVVRLIATAGAGKTTAALEFLSQSANPVAWLTLDESERAPGRLLTYLSAALSSVGQADDDLVTSALREDLPHAEVAGILAESTDGEMTLVIDEVEWIVTSPESLETLSAFLRYAPRSLRTLLISRRDTPLRLGHDRMIGTVSESELAFTVGEAAEALEKRGHDPAQAGEATLATGGWVAGVLFEAWKSPDHVHGSGGESDALRGYLATEIMRSLAESEANFLIATSVLDEVTAERATAIGIVDAEESLRVLNERNLPVAFSSDGITMRCHRRFREYLLEELSTRQPVRARELRRSVGRLLAEEGRFEQAVEQLLSANDAPSAIAYMEKAVPAVLARLDLAVIDRWLQEIAPSALRQSAPLLHAAVLVNLEKERWGAATQYADRLLEISGAGFAADVDPARSAIIAWAYLLVDRPQDALNVAEAAESSLQTEAVRFTVLAGLPTSDVHYRDRPVNSNSLADSLLARVDYSHGRLREVLAMSTSLWGPARSTFVAALRAVGRVEEALRICESSPHFDSMVHVHAEALADLHRPQEARAVLSRGRDRLWEGGSPVYRAFHTLLEIMLDLRFDGDAAAAAEKLTLLEQERVAGERIRIYEQVDMFWGLLHLSRGEDQLAVARLRSSVKVMTEWDRLLNLAQAGVYLAEAEWRVGNPAAADDAADLALRAADRQGSRHLLLQALLQFPVVVSRRIDSLVESDSPWHDIGRTLMSQGHQVGASIAPRIYVSEFGKGALFVDGVEMPLKLSKSVEVASYLVAHGLKATRTELLSALFEGRGDDSARSYLRQAINGLRHVLPDDASIIVDGEHVTWHARRVASESQSIEYAMRKALVLSGRERLKALRDPLEKIAAGPFLPDSVSGWATERGRQLSGMANDIRFEAAKAAFDLGNIQTAEELMTAVLDHDPFREAAWRLAMRLAAEFGNGDLVIARYRACEVSLQQIGVRPAESTTRLLADLRR